MNPKPNYFSGWEGQQQNCSRCDWTGLGSEAAVELFTGLLQVDCPECDSRLFLVTMPTAAQITEAAATGNPIAVSMQSGADKRRLFLLRREATLLRDGRALPALDGDVLDFYLTLADNHGEVWLVLAFGTGERPNDHIETVSDPRVLHGELAVFEDTEPAGRIAGVLADRYGSRFRHLNTGRALLYLGGDNWVPRARSDQRWVGMPHQCTRPTYSATVPISARNDRVSAPVSSSRPTTDGSHARATSSKPTSHPRTSSAVTASSADSARTPAAATHVGISAVRRSSMVRITAGSPPAAPRTSRTYRSRDDSTSRKYPAISDRTRSGPGAPVGAFPPASSRWPARSTTAA